MALVLGLGNPGPRYARTRHNVGFRVVEELARRWTARPAGRHPAFRAWVAERGGRRVELLEPLTFMNLSGGALEAWVAERGAPVEPGELLVVADDVYLPAGFLRLRARGSSGGHRGFESLEGVLGTREWARLRVGVSGAGNSAELREHVLEEFAPEEEAVVEQAVGLAADAVECWLERGLKAAMNEFNRKVRKEESGT